MTQPTVDLNSIQSGQALTLAVGWISGRKTKLRQVAIGDEVAAAFRDVVRASLSDLMQREAEVWTPEADLAPETYLVLPERDLGDAPALGAEHGGASLADALKSAEALPPIHPDDLPAGDLSFYALTLGDVAGRRAVFLRRSNPRRGLRKGRIFTFLTDSLQRVEAPIFAFDEFIDLVFVGDQVCILSQAVFAAIFRDQDTLAAQIPVWGADLQGSVPMTDQTRAQVEARASRDSRLRARLESIVRRGHLQSVSPATLRSAMVDAGLDVAVLLDSKGRLTVDDANVPQVLNFLNEDLFAGALTGTGFRADKKAAR